VCTLNDFCSGGFCTGDPNPCSDGDPCTIDQCDNFSGCFNTFSVGELCDDGNPCTAFDVCLDQDPGGQGCYGFEETDCSDGDECTDNTCDGAGGCNPPTPTVCDDGSACTSDTCDSGTGCVYTDISGSCNDNNACTSDTCDDATGCVYTDISGSCDDGDPCTADSCDSGSGCVYTPIAGCGCTSTDNPKNLAYWKRLCNRGPSGGDAITAADASCVASQGTTFATVDEVKDICDALNGQTGISNTCSAGNAQLMALALNICHERVCDGTAIDSNNTDATTVGEAYDDADAALSAPTGNGCFYSKKILAEINGGQALVNFSASSLKLDTTKPVVEGRTTTLNTNR